MKRLSLLASVCVLVCVCAGSCNGTDKKFKGYKKTDSGLYYKFEKENKDARTPKEGDFLYLQVSYRMDNDSIRMDEREMVDILYPSKYPGDLFEAYAIMHEGDDAHFMLKADSFFVYMFGTPQLPDFVTPETMIDFHVKMNKIKSVEDFQQEEQELIENYIRENNIAVQPLESGLYYIETKKGTGKGVQIGDSIRVHYTGKFLDGTVFDSSLQRGEPMAIRLAADNLIQGFVEGLLLTQDKGTATLIIPSKIGYGASHPQMPIPPYAPLLFEIELVEVVK